MTQNAKLVLLPRELPTCGAEPAPASQVLVDEITEIVEEAGLSVSDRHAYPERPAVLLPVPDGLHPDVATLLRGRHPTGLYSHQARAIAALIGGEDVAVSTGTSSGKSEIYLAAGADTVKASGARRVLALYPARALIQDQMDKWQCFLEPLGLRAGIIDGGVPTSSREGILRAGSDAWLSAWVRPPGLTPTW